MKKTGIEYDDSVKTAFIGNIYECNSSASGQVHRKHVFGFGRRIATLENNDFQTIVLYHPDLRRTPNEITDSTTYARNEMRVRHTPFGQEINP